MRPVFAGLEMAAARDAHQRFIETIVQGSKLDFVIATTTSLVITWMALGCVAVSALGVWRRFVILTVMVRYTWHSGEPADVS